MKVHGLIAVTGSGVYARPRSALAAGAIDTSSEALMTDTARMEFLKALNMGWTSIGSSGANGNEL